ncbi:hypothetical protein DM860_001185 [Cuscuta australis]|uniref:RING-type E3 ubiquitin transferase n=1 Tax=Cuscuta australis TaxID=267555 RepID=A0A328DT49_9ASTE|nr:hypothetical protein DM860_001185 [Cuscuta australis]
MAASFGYERNGSIRPLYEANCYIVLNKNLNSSLRAAAPIATAPPIAASETATLIAAAAAAPPGTSSSAPVVFRVQCVLRLSVAGNPVNEFLEEKDWRETRQSSLELPWSRDGLIIDDISLELKLSETLTALRVSKDTHQYIMDKLRFGAAAISHLLNSAPKFVVHILEVTHITLPLIDEEGQAIYPEHIPYNDEVYTDVDYHIQTEKHEIHQANFVDSVKKLIVGTREVNEKDDDASIQDWFLKLTNAIYRVAWQVTEEEDAKEEEEEKEAKEEEGIEEEEEKGEKEEEEEKEANGEGEKKEANEEEEWTCPTCLGIIESHEAWSEMPCCSRAFHCDCISPWIKRLHKCPWCRSSLPLVLQSARGLIERHNSEYILYPSPLGLHDQLVVLWHLLSEKSWWTNQVVHEVGCMCGCHSNKFEVIRA